MEKSNGSLRGEENVRKVYISDSPVADDNIEYNYVSSDIEEEFDRQPIVKTDNMPPEPDLSEVDELAKEAEYQRDLQDRLQRTTLDDPDTRSEDSGSNSSPTELEQTGKDLISDNMLEWKNPPANPFLNQGGQLSNTHNGATSQNYGGANESMEPLTSGQGTQVISSQHQMLPAAVQYQNTEEVKPLNGPSVEDTDSVQQGTTGQQLNQYQQPQHSPVLLPQQQPKQQQSQQQQSQQQPQYQQYNYQQAGSFEEDAYIAQQRQAELERIQYQQLQQQQLQQQQLFVQQQMFLQQQRLQQVKQQPNEPQPVPEGLVMQRNAPVMYLQNPGNQNEYYAVTPRDTQHAFGGGYEQFTNDQQSDVSLVSEVEESSLKDTRAVVAPKPVHPSKDYVTKNKFRAAGQLSAKPGYSERLVQKRIEQEQLKEWAPGMVIPRKKAASADDIIRDTEQEEMVSSEDVWSKRAQGLAAAKQARLTGGNKGKRRTSKISNLKRYPSDNSLSKKTAARVPPIVPPARTDPPGYQTNQGWSANDPYQEKDYALPGQINGHINSSAASPTTSYGKPGPPLGQVYPPAGGYQSNIPLHPPVYQHHGQGLPVYATQPSPIYGEGAYSPQYQNYDNVYQQGPPSGGYHHQPRQDIHRQPPEYSQPHPPGHPINPQAPYNISQNQQHFHQPAYDYSGYLNPAEQYQEPSIKDREGKQYDGSPHSSPFPPYPVNNYVTDGKKIALNPYSMVPPITDPNKLAEMQNSGSYVMAYQKEKEKAEKLLEGPTYKVYTMKDYKNLKLEYKLGGLGPSQNPEMIKEKNEIRTKQLQYAKEAMEQEKKKPQPSPRKSNLEHEIQHISGRQLAVEYAKHVPKPKVAPPFGSQPKQSSSTGDAAINLNHGKVAAMKPLESTPQPNSRATPRTHQIDLDELEDLQRRHEEEQRAVADIQYKMQQAA